MFLAADDGDGDEAAGKFQRGSDRLFKTRRNTLLDEQAVHNDFDGVILALVERWQVVHRIKLAVDAHPDVAILAELFKFFAIRAFTASNDGRKDHHAVVGLRELALKNGLDDGFARLARNGLAAIGTVRYTDRSVDNAQIIVNFRDGPDSRAR